jgi:DnaJ-class molecular chaperone
LAEDPYTTLGVKKDATQDDIQKAYRRLAKKLHPDLNPGNKIAEDKFKEVSAAYDLLGDPDKRARFDRGEIDASGTERPRQQYYRDFADQNGWSAYTNNSGFSDFGDFAGSEDILSEIFGRAGSAGRRRRGQDVRYHLELSFLDAVNGGKQSIVPPDGATLDVNIPPGTRDGQILRLRGKGRPAPGEVRQATRSTSACCRILLHPQRRQHLSGPADIAEGGGAGRQGSGAHPRRSGRGGGPKMVKYRSRS